MESNQVRFILYLWYSVKGAQLMASGKQNRDIAFRVFSSSSFWYLAITSLWEEAK